jgi:LysM repeat protein
MKNVNKVLLSAMIIPMLLAPIKAFAGETTTSYTVQNGDSLWKISTKLGVYIDYLKTVNNLNNLNMNNLIPGQTLKLIPDVHNYIVKSGDSLWKIGTANKLKVEYLKVLNKFNANIINVGQVIKLRPDTITYTVMQGIQHLQSASYLM